MFDPIRKRELVRETEDFVLSMAPKALLRLHATLKKLNIETTVKEQLQLRKAIQECSFVLKHRAFFSYIGPPPMRVCEFCVLFL